MSVSLPNSRFSSSPKSGVFGGGISVRSMISCSRVFLRWPVTTEASLGVAVADEETLGWVESESEALGAMLEA